MGKIELIEPMDCNNCVHCSPGHKGELTAQACKRFTLNFLERTNWWINLLLRYHPDQRGQVAELLITQIEWSDSKRGPVKCKMGNWMKSDGSKKTYKTMDSFNRVKGKEMDYLTQNGRCQDYIDSRDKKETG